MAAGGQHTVAVTETSVYSWGANSAGQLGTRTFRDKAAPTPVRDLENAGVCQVACGRQHTLFLCRSAPCHPSLLAFLDVTTVAKVRCLSPSNRAGYQVHLPYAWHSCTISVTVQHCPAMRHRTQVRACFGDVPFSKSLNPSSKMTDKASHMPMTSLKMRRCSKTAVLTDLQGWDGVWVRLNRARAAALPEICWRPGGQCQRGR